MLGGIIRLPLIAVVIKEKARKVVKGKQVDPDLKLKPIALARRFPYQSNGRRR